MSAALVLHHFGSKDGLRRECDAYVLGVLRSGEDRAATLSDIAGLAEKLDAARPLRRYLARTLIDGSSEAAALFDEIVIISAEALGEGERAGWAHPATDDRARAAVYVSWLLAPLVLGDHISRALGETDPHHRGAMLRYSHAMVEMLTHGVFADRDALQAWDALAGSAVDRSRGAQPERQDHHDEGGS